jgi:hypothetical protein
VNRKFDHHHQLPLSSIYQSIETIVPVKDSDQSVDFKEAKDQTDDFLQHQIVKDSL